MTTLPMFPLNLVAFPHEKLNLHIFEPRYKQLINDAVEHNTTFGIPTYIDKKLMPYGTEMSVVKIAKKYPGGEMDIYTVGRRVFKLEKFENPQEGKLHAGGEVTFINHDENNQLIDNKLFELVESFYSFIQKRYDYISTTAVPFSYRIAHKLGLTIEEEYKLLLMPTEKSRQEFLKKHLIKILPIMSEIERTKEKIALNGHFKNLDPLNF